MVLFTDLIIFLSVEWSAQLHVNILQPDHLSENIVAISQHSEYSDGENKEAFLLCVEWLIPVVVLSCLEKYFRFNATYNKLFN